MTIYGPKTGKTVYTLTRSSRPASHNHIAIVDSWGDGYTTIDADHQHRISGGEVQEAAGHGHRRLGSEEIREAVA